MGKLNFDDPEFKDHVLEIAPALIEESKSVIKNDPKYKILKNNLLENFRLSLANPNSLFTIVISEEDILSLEIKYIKENLSKYINDAIKRFNFIEVNNKFEILNAEKKELESTTATKKYLKEISNQKYCAFFFGVDGIDSYIKGNNEDELNKFYTSKDLRKYSEKKDISQIREVLKTYQEMRLNNQVEYSYFFAERSTLNRSGLSDYGRNILKNKPEKFMRDHLRTFLKDNMQHSFFIENELASSKRELDIYTEVDGEFYFFEIKWLGVSISDCGTKISSPYTHSRAREGVTQTLEYIQELIESMGENVKCGYLILFDARDNKTPINYQKFDFVHEDLKKYMNLFEITDELKLDNQHPA